MSDILTIKIKKRSQSKLLIHTITLFPFLFETFFFIPSVKKYVLDLCWLFLLILIIKFRDKINMKNERKVIVLISSFLIYTFIFYLFKYQNVLYFLWGVRNNFRFYIYFLSTTFFLSKNDVDDYFSLFDTLFWINAIVCFIQFFLLGYSQDTLGGLFGVEKGCNGYLNNFFVIMVAKNVIFYLHKKVTLNKCSLVCITALIIAAMAELKFFYVEFIIILFISMIITEFSRKKLFMLFFSSLAIMISLNILSYLFPHFSEFFSFENILQIAIDDKGYTMSGDMNRLTAIPIINESFLTTTSQRLFGLGLGNCDTSAFDFLNTPFSKKYSWLHYSWLSYAFMYLESGIIGLIFFFGFFVQILKYSYKLMIKENKNKEYYQITFIIAICAILIAIYNSSLRAESGYMIYFMLSIPFVLQREKRRKG